MEAERDPFPPKAPPGQHELPYDDGEPMESKRHRMQMNLLIDTLDEHWAERDDVYVSGNMFVYFSELQTKGEHFRGPDVFVVLDTERKSRKSWVAWEEGGRLPDVVIELLSESTEHVDRGDKMRIYARIWKTGSYVLYDPFSHVLEVYKLDAEQGAYVRVAPNERGDCPVARTGLAVGLRPGDIREEPGPFLRWIRPDGSVIERGWERAYAERKRADDADERADEARKHADEARKRADEEQAAREAAERRIAELEAKLRDPSR